MRRAFLLLALIASSCTKPTEPCDPRGSTTGDWIRINCDVSGVNVRCTSFFTNQNDLYICKYVYVDVTKDTVFTWSDPSTADVDPADPGLLRPVSAGPVQLLSASYKSATRSFPFTNSPAFGFLVSPTDPAVQLAPLHPGAYDGAVWDGHNGVAGVEMSITEDGLPPQHCTTDAGGLCLEPPRLYVFQRGAVRIIASKPGYLTSDTVTDLPLPTFTNYYDVLIRLQKE